MTHKLTNSFKKRSDEHHIFYVTLIFYLIIWVLDPPNKIVASSFSILLLAYYHKLSNFRISLLLTYLASTIVLTGKTYVIQLIPPGFYSEIAWPFGYNLIFTITPSLILLSFMGVILARDLIISKFKKLKLNNSDLVFIAFSLWPILSDIVSSKRAYLSLLVSLTGSTILFAYLYIKLLINDKKKLVKLVIYLFASLVIFESLISIQQYSISSPVFKSIESKVDIEYWGKAADEIEFTFRPVGTFVHANNLGIWLAYLLGFIFVSLFIFNTSTLLLTFIIGSIALSMTLSRSSWLGYSLSISVILYWLQKFHNKKLPNFFSKHKNKVFLIVTSILLLFVLPRTLQTANSFTELGGWFVRSRQIKESLNLISTHPIFGVGTGMSILAGIEQNPTGIFSELPLATHNWYLLAATEQGLVYIFLFTLIIFILIKKTTIFTTKNKENNLFNFFNIAVFSGLLSLLTIGFFQPFMNISMIYLIFNLLKE